MYDGCMFVLKSLCLLRSKSFSDMSMGHSFGRVSAPAASLASVLLIHSYIAVSLGSLTQSQQVFSP